MNIQRTFFDVECEDDNRVKRMSHSHDPLTSKQAASKHVRSGKAGIHRGIVLRLVQSHPGRTAVELWRLADESDRATLKEKQEVRRRLTDLKRDGLVVQGRPRPCTAAGSTMVTWNPS